MNTKLILENSCFKNNYEYNVVERKVKKIMNKFEWKRDPWREQGCLTNPINPGGWYVTGTTQLVQTSYKNPATGKPYTTAELNAMQPGVTVPTYVQPANPASATSIWITVGIVLLVIVGVAIWFFTK